MLFSSAPTHRAFLFFFPARRARATHRRARDPLHVLYPVAAAARPGAEVHILPLHSLHVRRRWLSASEQASQHRRCFRVTHWLRLEARAVHRGSVTASARARRWERAALGRLYTAAEAREGGRGVMEERRKQGGVLQHEKNKATTDAIYHYTGVSLLQLWKLIHINFHKIKLCNMLYRHSAHFHWLISCK